jgi:hypothetical protein
LLTLCRLHISCSVHPSAGQLLLLPIPRCRTPTSSLVVALFRLRSELGSEFVPILCITSIAPSFDLLPYVPPLRRLSLRLSPLRSRFIPLRPHFREFFCGACGYCVCDTYCVHALLELVVQLRLVCARYIPLRYRPREFFFDACGSCVCDMEIFACDAQHGMTFHVFCLLRFQLDCDISAFFSRFITLVDCFIALVLCIPELSLPKHKPAFTFAKLILQPLEHRPQALPLIFCSYKLVLRLLLVQW